MIGRNMAVDDLPTGAYGRRVPKTFSVVIGAVLALLVLAPNADARRAAKASERSKIISATKLPACMPRSSIKTYVSTVDSRWAVAEANSDKCADMPNGARLLVRRVSSRWRLSSDESQGGRRCADKPADIAVADLGVFCNFKTASAPTRRYRSEARAYWAASLEVTVAEVEDRYSNCGRWNRRKPQWIVCSGEFFTGSDDCITVNGTFRSRKLPPLAVTSAVSCLGDE
jgi:hypothetical protein